MRRVAWVNLRHGPTSKRAGIFAPRLSDSRKLKLLASAATEILEKFEQLLRTSKQETFDRIRDLPVAMKDKINVNQHSPSISFVPYVHLLSIFGRIPLDLILTLETKVFSVPGRWMQGPECQMLKICSRLQSSSAVHCAFIESYVQTLVLWYD